jgi:hypothetical protein
MPRKGQHHSEEAQKRIASKLRGRKRSEATRAKIADGRSQSPQTRERMREAAKRPQETRRERKDVGGIQLLGFEIPLEVIPPQLH